MNPLLLLLLVPLVEIAVFIQVGAWIGVLPTIALIVLAGIAGSVLLRSQGLAVLRQAQASADRGEAPVAAVLHGFCVVVAAILLIIPGFVSDIVGILLFIPKVRTALGQWFLTRMQGSARVWADGRPVDPRHPPAGRVIDVDYEEVPPEAPADGDAPRLEESRWGRDGRDGRGPDDRR